MTRIAIGWGEGKCIDTIGEFTAARCLVTSFRCRCENEKISTLVDETIFRDSSYFCTLLPVLLKIWRFEDSKIW